MNFHYDEQSDSLYIELSSKPGLDSEEVAEGVVVDYDKEDLIVGLDMEHASRHISLGDIVIQGFSPAVKVQPAGRS